MFVYQTRGTNIVKNTVSIFSLIFVFLLVLPPVAELNPIYPLLLLRSCTGSSHSVRSPIGRILLASARIVQSIIIIGRDSGFCELKVQGTEHWNHHISKPGIH
ncbi:uncharacterized protein LOC111798456 isoform X7 [Cucurbita pepo subsp. pepo]|uniref:uncharacterized protein LOC111798456 isoform X7 n=1 Tax=Cucurbita pepo subsp. pepo TaxID=3664 RepID=UPI000C9D80B4|nr:uncharacterized protein LOC111798456 isoform X7 [Cucurbita pepo subsp. pepo]